MSMTNSQRLREARKKRGEEEKKSSSSSSDSKSASSLSNSQQLEKFRLEKTINFDTFESDLSSIGTTIQGIYNGWQSQDTMKNTRTSVEAMQERINAYQKYQKAYGGTDITDIASGYQTVIDGWDDLTSLYGSYKNADAFNTAKKKSEMDTQFSGLTYDEVQAKKKEYAEDSDEYKYLSEYMNYSDLTDFDKALKNASGDYKKNLQKASNQHELDHAFDRYKHYMDAEDFKEKSQYASTKSDDWHRGLTTRYGLGYEDVTYEYINDIDGMRSKIKDKGVIYGWDSGKTTTSEEKKGYDKLNADEIAVYNYIYQTEGKDKAQEYLDAMEVTLTKRVYDESTKTWKDNVDSVGGSIGMSALSVPMSILGGFTGAMESLGDKLQGKEYNPYGYYKQPTNFASDTRQYVGENIEESTDFEISGQNIPRFLYDTGMSMADSAVGAMSLGRAYTPLMGMSAYQQKAKELTEAGEDAKTVQSLALANGLAEVAFEYFSIDKLLKIKNADSLKKVLTQTLKQAGIEASEEMLTESSNILWDKFIRGDESDLGQMKQDLISRGYSEEEAEKEVKKQALSQVGWAGVGGALSGGGMGGVASASNYATNKSIGNQIRSNERVDDMWDMSALTPEVSEAYKAYTEYANKGINADNIKDAQLGNLYATVDSEARETLASKKSTKGQKVDAVSDLHKLSVIGTENTVSKRVKSLAQGEVTEVTATGNSAKIEGIKMDGEKTTLLTSEGEVSADDMTFTSNDAELVAYAETMSEENANLLLSQYDGKTNVSEYVDSFNLAVAYAENGFTSDAILENKGVLTDAQASAIYKSVILDGVAKQQKAIDEVNAKHGKTMTIQGTFDDSVIDYNNATSDGSKVNWNSLTSTQRSAIKFAKGFSKATGVNIRFVQSKVVDGKRVGKNGSYDAETNTIEIDVYAGVIDANTVKDSIIPTLSHEVTHWMKAKAPSMYNKMREHIMGTLASDGKLTSEDRVATEMARMKAAHPDMKVTSEMAIDEIVARACEDMLSNSNTARKLLNQLSESEQKSFIGKVKETFDNLMQWVNDLLAQYKSNSKEAEILREYKHRLKQLSKMWDKALAESIQTNQNLQKEGKTGEDVVNEALNRIGLQYDAETKSVSPSMQFSEKTWTGSEYVQNREKAIAKVSEALGVSKKKASQYIDNINSVARMIADDRARLDYDANIDSNATVVKPNSEYKWSVDMSTLCAKRLLFTGTFDEIQKLLPNTALDSEDIVSLRQMMKDAGYEVACGICYVESTRREIGTITKDFIERYKIAQKSGKPISRLNSSGVEVELQEKGTKAKFYTEEGYTPTLAELNTTDIDLVKRDHPQVYSAYLAYMNARGQAKPKLLETRAEYKGEILSHFRAKSAVKSRNEAGGLRLQSFSDFEVPHLIDMMQITMDMARVGLKSQAYTKVVNFAEAFGDTGIKINLSLIAKDSGLDENGNLVFDDVEGISHEDAFRLRDKYSKNVGTILVGKNDAHIIKAMSDPRIDYIIPFHKSSWKESLYDSLGLTGYDDYTDSQNEKPLDKNRKIKNFDPSEYWDFSKTGEENAQIYLAKCIEDGRIPKFPQFQGYEGYWKLLIDFKMYDNDGVGSPQTVVTPNFNMEECSRILNEYKGGHKTFPVAHDIVSKFVSEYKESHPQEQYPDRGLLREFTRDEIKSILKVKEREILKNTKNVYDFVDRAINNGERLNFGYWGVVTSDVVDRIKDEITDISPKNRSDLFKYDEYSLRIRQSEIAHLKKAGMSLEETRDYVTKIPRIVSEFDTVKYTETYHDGQLIKGLRFSKVFEDGKMYSYLMISNKKRTFTVKTTFKNQEDYIKKEPSLLLDVNTPSLTSETRSASALSNIISHDSEKNTTNFSDREDGNTASYNGKPFWSGSVSLIDGTIEEVHSFEEAQDADFHHSFYFSYSQLEKMDNEENAFFFVEGGKVQMWRDDIPPHIIRKIKEQISIFDATRYSDRDNVSVYEAMGEEERLIAENQKLKKDIARLKGAISTDEVPIRRFRSLADYLNKLSGSNMNRETLGDLLEDVYTYIQTTEHLQWNDVLAKTYDIANSMMNRNMNVSINYFKEVMAQVRKDKVTLGAEQRAEAEKLFGGYGNFHKAMFGRVNIVNDGTPLAEMWQTWAKLYPSVFKADVNGVDQVKALVDTVDTLKATSTLMGEYEREEAIRHLATEIYNQFWNIASDSSEDVKKAKAEHRKMMEELRKEYEQRQKEKSLHPVGETALKYEKLLKRVSERDKAELKKAKALGKQRMADYKERAERNTKIQSITQKALTLNKWLMKNSKDEHIHEAMKGPVINLLQAIDFSSKQLLGMNGGSKAGTETQKDISLSKALSQVKDMMADANVGKEELVALYGIDMNDDIKAMLDSVDNILRTVGDNAYVLNQMSLDDLKTLDKMVGAIKYAVTQMNKFHTVNHAKGIANLSQSTILEADSLGKAKIHDGMRGWTDKLLNWGNALPYYAFKRFGEGGRKVYEALQDGWDTFAFHVKEIIDYTKDTYTSKEVKAWAEEIKTFKVLVPASDVDLENPNYKPEYQSVQMTVPQIMSLYCLVKRQQAKDHLMGGGIRVADIKTKKGIISQSDGVILVQDDIVKIIGSLTDRQIEVADTLQEFMNTTCTDWGNEVSMLRFGYKAFGEENYFPIQSDKNNLAENDETEQNNSLFRLLNMSFTKSTIDKANNRIVISDIFDVFAQHTSDMAKYNALALPVLDAFRWYNYKEKGQKGETQFITKSVKQSLEKAFGRDAQNYITTFLRDINGSENTSRDTVGKHFFSNAKIASVAANLRVAFLQPTSYLRASAVIDTKYLAKALIHKPKIGRAEKYCGIAQWKALGFYDTNIQRGVTNLIKHDETWKDKAIEKSMKGAEWGDKITWGYLWNACELEVREKQKNLKVGSDEFYTAIGKRLREVIYATQVVDSTMTRSQMMRSSDMYDKMLTSFASEPTLAYNMMQDVSWEIKLAKRRGEGQSEMRKHRRHFVRVAMAYTITNIACALIESGFDAYRDDEEEEMDLETFMKMYLSNFLMDMSFTGKVPYIKEFTSIVQGFTSSRTDTQWMQNFGYALKGIMKIATEGEGNVYSAFKNLLKGFSYVSGLPFFNAWRDSVSLLDKTDILTSEELEEMFNSMIE